MPQSGEFCTLFSLHTSHSEPSFTMDPVALGVHDCSHTIPLLGLVTLIQSSATRRIWKLHKMPQHGLHPLCSHLWFQGPQPPKQSGLTPKRHILNGRDSIMSKVASLETIGMLSQRENMVENSQSDIFLKTNTGNCVFIFSWRLQESRKHMWVGGGFVLYTAAVTHLGGNTQCKLDWDSGGFVKHRCLCTTSSLGWQSKAQYGGLHLENAWKIHSREERNFLPLD